MKTFVIFSVFVFFSSDLALVQSKSREQSDRRPILYDNITRGSTKSDRLAAQIYSHQFRVLEVTEKDGFQSGRLKGEWYEIRDPPSIRLWEIPGRVKVVFGATVSGSWGIAIVRRDFAVVIDRDVRQIAGRPKFRRA